MSAKRPPTKTGSTSDEWNITDEWGMYDPAKAGMPALFARLGRPVLRAGTASTRRERRRALRPERSADGVGLAIAEARKRAGIDVDTAPVLPAPGGNPARAMRIALRARAAQHTSAMPVAEPVVPAPQPPPPPPADLLVAAEVPLQEAPAPKKRGARRAAAIRQVDETPIAAAAVPVPGVETEAPKPRPRKTVRVRTRQTAPVPEPAAAPLVAASTPAPTPHTPAAPSPRRPRGAVPLAAWARAVAEEPKPDPRRADKRGFWRGLFRIPAEVALVEYAHGARIHRLLIEAGDDYLPDLI